MTTPTAVESFIARWHLEAKKVGADRTAKEQAIDDKGLVAVLASYHADLDAAVREARSVAAAGISSAGRRTSVNGGAGKGKAVGGRQVVGVRYCLQ